MTPIQELIEVLKIHRDTAFEKSRMYESEHYHSRGQAFDDAISFAEAHLEKEKEVLITTAADQMHLTEEEALESAKQYYNETFKIK